MNDDKGAKETELDREERELREEAERIDPRRPSDADIPDDTTSAAPRTADHAQQPAKSAARPGGDKQPDAPAAESAASKTTKTETKDAKTEPADKAKAGEPDESKMTPFQKERRRLDETWKRTQAEKEELRRQREQFDSERRAWEQQRSATPAKAADAQGVKAEDYEAIAKEFEAEGKLRQAETARAKAKEMREQAGAGSPGAPRERWSPAEVAEMQQQWQKNLERAGKENPELTQEGSPLRSLVAEILKGTPVLHQSGDGILLAVAHAKVALKAKRADELEGKVGELEKEIKRLTELTSLPSGGASPAAQAKKFDELTLAEQEAALREDAELAA